MQNSLYKLFEHKCVLEVCQHIHPIMIKIHPVFFLIPISKSSFSNQAVLRFLSEWRSSVQATPTIVDWQDRFTLDPPWVSCHQSIIVSTPVQGKTRSWNNVNPLCLQRMSGENIPWHPLKTQRINIISFWRECTDPDLPTCVYVHANHSWSCFI